MPSIEERCNKDRCARLEIERNAGIHEEIPRAAIVLKIVARMQGDRKIKKAIGRNHLDLQTNIPNDALATDRGARFDIEICTAFVEWVEETEFSVTGPVCVTRV